MGVPLDHHSNSKRSLIPVFCDPNNQLLSQPVVAGMSSNDTCNTQYPVPLRASQARCIHAVLSQYHEKVWAFVLDGCVGPQFLASQSNVTILYGLQTYSDE